MQILDGKIVSQHVKELLKTKTDLLKAEGKRLPHLAAILVGTNGASETYVASKVKTCNEIGFKSTLIRFDETVAEADLTAAIERLNNDEDVDETQYSDEIPKDLLDKIKSAKEEDLKDDAQDGPK